MDSKTETSGVWHFYFCRKLSHFLLPNAEARSIKGNKVVRRNHDSVQPSSISLNREESMILYPNG